MKTPMKSFEIIKEMYEYFVKKSRDLEPKLMICEKEDFSNVENAINKLSDYERAIAIIKNKLMYEVEPFDFMDYDTYEDYYQNYFEQSFEDSDGEGYPDWWLEKDEFTLLNHFFRGKLK